ncbi:MAG: UDP-4-amino-4,6-dideoxy-N-acetyl-beta-L-altrosamine N-acetyltransferase [Methanolobus sp.]|nr:UDP-4-amino-4,6-dideoxy-N-acetyl-beta-L-altrosamine N-acetyltransferase [Methanolobus sp.]
MATLNDDFDINNTKLKNFLNISTTERDMILEWRNHESIRKWMYSDTIISPQEHISFLSNLIDDNKNIYWVAENDAGFFLGTISLNKIDFKNKHAYIGIYSNPYNEIKNKGHLLIQCIKKLAFEIAGLHTLKLEVINNNQKAIDFYKKQGFNEEGRLKEFVIKDGYWLDVIVMGIMNNSEV